MTMAQALQAARDMQRIDLTSVYDVAMSLAAYMAQQAAVVDGFESKAHGSIPAIRTAYTNAIGDHMNLEDQIIGEIAAHSANLNQIRNSFLSRNDTTNMTGLAASQKDISDRVIALENMLNKLIYGAKEFANRPDNTIDFTDTWFDPYSSAVNATSSLAQIKSHLRSFRREDVTATTADPSTTTSADLTATATVTSSGATSSISTPPPASDASVDSTASTPAPDTFPDIVAALDSTILQAKAEKGTQLSDVSKTVGTQIKAASNVISNVVAFVKAALQL
jgi:hypothetical protein